MPLVQGRKHSCVQQIYNSFSAIRICIRRIPAEALRRLELSTTFKNNCKNLFNMNPDFFQGEEEEEAVANSGLNSASISFQCVRGEGD